jgi:hypothetical protein
MGGQGRTWWKRLVAEEGLARVRLFRALRGHTRGLIRGLARAFPLIRATGIRATGTLKSAKKKEG